MRPTNETPYSPTVRRLRLSAALRKLREDAGRNATEVAKVLGWPTSKLTHLERGEAKRPKPEDVDSLLRVYGVTDPRERETLLGLARDTRYRGWWRGYGDVFRGVLPDLEGGASEIRTYEALYIPGLLQTQDYAAAVFASEGHDQAAIERRVVARMVRQQILAREHPPTLLALVDEAALRKLIGGLLVMRDQLLHLVKSASRPHVSVRVVPDSAGAHPGMMGAFVLLGFPSAGDPRMVYLESARTSLCLERPEDIALYDGIFDRVCAVALSPGESVRLITAIAAQLGPEGARDHG